MAKIIINNTEPPLNEIKEGDILIVNNETCMVCIENTPSYTEYYLVKLRNGEVFAHGDTLKELYEKIKHFTVKKFFNPVIEISEER